MPQQRQTLPENPSLDQLKIQAKELLKSIRAQDAGALELLDEPKENPRLADAQRALARSYGYASWPRLKAYVESLTQWPALRAAIDGDDVGMIRRQLRDHPKLRTHRPTNNAKDLLSYAAQRNARRAVEYFLPDQTYDRQLALSRASMYDYFDIMRLLVEAGADPKGPYGENRWDYGTPMTAICECLNANAMRHLLELGGSLEWDTSNGKHNDARAMLLATYSRSPETKAACLAVSRDFDFDLPDTAPMALHKRDFVRLEAFVDRDKNVLAQGFTEAEIYPPEVGIAEWDGLTAAPLPGATLLHMAIEWDDVEAARWLLDRGANPNARAWPGPDGYNDHPPLFNAVVTMGRRTEGKARLLIEAGADPTTRANLAVLKKYTDEPEWQKLREFRQVTAVEFASVDWPDWAQNPAAVTYLRSLAA